MKERRLVFLIRTASTTSLTRMLVSIVASCLALLMVEAILDKRYDLNAGELSSLLVLFLYLLMALAIFSLGLLFFVRQEHPISIMRQWFGITRFSRGGWARLYGCIFMMFGMLGIFGALVALLRVLTRLLGL